MYSVFLDADAQFALHLSVLECLCIYSGCGEYALCVETPLVTSFW
jgi:hypothetical protein